jgi:hypothetical protein
LTSPPGQRYCSTMDWGANSMSGGGIQLAQKKQILSGLTNLISRPPAAGSAQSREVDIRPGPGYPPFREVRGYC